MRLKKVTHHDPIERVALSLRQSTTLRIEAYRAHYKETYGETIERSHLIEQVLLDYMAQDKEFAKAMDRNPTLGLSVENAGQSSKA